MQLIAVVHLTVLNYQEETAQRLAILAEVVMMVTQVLLVIQTPHVLLYHQLVRWVASEQLAGRIMTVCMVFAHR
jgi:hypothetical protein